MNPNYVDKYYDQGGDANGLAGIILWLAFLSIVFWITGLLKLSYKASLWCWGAFNIFPLAWTLTRDPGIPLFLGMCAMAAFSWALGRSWFDGRERERILQEKFDKEEETTKNK